MDSNPFTEFKEDSHPHSGTRIEIFIPEHSKAWKWILFKHNNLLANNSNTTSFYRVESFRVLVKVACEISGKLDKNLKLSKCNVHLKFFDDICAIAEKIMSDVNMSSSPSNKGLEVRSKYIL